MKTSLAATGSWPGHPPRTIKACLRIRLPLRSNLPVRAIVDTGAQATVGNVALQLALRKRLKRDAMGPDRIQGATGEWQEGVGTRSTQIRLGDLTVRDAHVTFADLRIFENWEMNDEPALLIGMDLIGLVDQLVIDYRRRELHIKPRD